MSLSPGIIAFTDELGDTALLRADLIEAIMADSDQGIIVFQFKRHAITLPSADPNADAIALHEELCTHLEHKEAPQ